MRTTQKYVLTTLFLLLGIFKEVPAAFAASEENLTPDASLLRVVDDGSRQGPRWHQGSVYYVDHGIISTSKYKKPENKVIYVKEDQKVLKVNQSSQIYLRDVDDKTGVEIKLTNTDTIKSDPAWGTFIPLMRYDYDQNGSIEANEVLKNNWVILYSSCGVLGCQLVMKPLGVNLVDTADDSPEIPLTALSLFHRDRKPQMNFASQMISGGQNIVFVRENDESVNLAYANGQKYSQVYHLHFDPTHVASSVKIHNLTYHYSGNCIGNPAVIEEIRNFDDPQWTFDGKNVVMSGEDKYGVWQVVSVSADETRLNKTWAADDYTQACGYDLGTSGKKLFTSLRYLTSSKVDKQFPMPSPYEIYAGRYGVVYNTFVGAGSQQLAGITIVRDDDGTQPTYGQIIAAASEQQLSYDPYIVRRHPVWDTKNSGWIAYELRGVLAGSFWQIYGAPITLSPALTASPSYSPMTSGGFQTSSGTQSNISSIISSIQGQVVANQIPPMLGDMSMPSSALTGKTILDPSVVTVPVVPNIASSGLPYPPANSSIPINEVPWTVCKEDHVWPEFAPYMNTADGATQLTTPSAPRDLAYAKISYDASHVPVDHSMFHLFELPKRAQVGHCLTGKVCGDFESGYQETYPLTVAEVRTDADGNKIPDVCQEYKNNDTDEPTNYVPDNGELPPPVSPTPPVDPTTPPVDPTTPPTGSEEKCSAPAVDQNATDPSAYTTDTDGDSFVDGCDVCPTNSKYFVAQRDSDGDGTGDTCEDPVVVVDPPVDPTTPPVDPIDPTGKTGDKNNSPDPILPINPGSNQPKGLVCSSSLSGVRLTVNQVLQLEALKENGEPLTLDLGARQVIVAKAETTGEPVYEGNDGYDYSLLQNGHNNYALAQKSVNGEDCSMTSGGLTLAGAGCSLTATSSHHGRVIIMLLPLLIVAVIGSVRQKKSGV